MHRGHGLLIRDVVSRAASQGLKSVIVTFEPHTRAVLFPGARQPILSTLEEKAKPSKPMERRISFVFRLPWSWPALSAGEFVQRYLIDRLKARQWVMGEGHTFGKNHGGNKNFSHESKGKNDICMVSAPSMLLHERVISSTEDTRKHR